MRESIFLMVIVFLAAILLNADKLNIDSNNTYKIESSELAILMRFAHEQAKELKVDIGNSQNKWVYNDQIESILTAKPTKPSVVGDKFDSFARHFIKKNQNTLDELSKESFNEMIESCVACHKEFCPGPVKTIKKLTIK